MGELATELDEAENQLTSSKKHVRFIDDRVSEQSNQSLEKLAYLGEYRECVVVPEQELACVLADV